MRKSIKIMVGVRVVVTLAAVLSFSLLTTKNIMNMEQSENASIEASGLLDRAQKAETAHYKWSSNLSNALYAGTEFTGSTEYDSCVLGQWIYGDIGTDDADVLDLRAQMEPLHKELHQSATYVLELLETDPQQAQAYYQETIQGNLGTLVGLLDKVVERSTVLNDESIKHMNDIMYEMHIITGICLALVLIFLLNMVFYVIKHVVKPILIITDKTRPLQEGHLNLELDYNANDEIGDLARTLNTSLGQIRQYIEDINRLMSQLSIGNFNVRASVPFIGDFRSIEESMESFTASLSSAIANINKVEHKVFGHARNLSDGAQLAAKGATEQASAVEEISATLNDLSRSAKQNIKMASTMLENAQLTSKQVNLSSEQMGQLIAAMSDISETSQQIEKIISTIESISFQTNILALNAAVEASRAGEAGKGFAVVAEEVRNLAGQSDQAAKATKELIENSVRAAERGNQIVQEVSESLHKTYDLVNQSNSAIEEIAGAVQIEATAVSQAAEGLRQISDVVQTNSANSEESATVSTELFEQVNLLQDQTRDFQLKQV